MPRHTIFGSIVDVYCHFGWLCLGVMSDVAWLQPIKLCHSQHTRENVWQSIVLSLDSRPMCYLLRAPYTLSYHCSSDIAIPRAISMASPPSAKCAKICFASQLNLQSKLYAHKLLWITINLLSHFDGRNQNTLHRQDTANKQTKRAKTYTYRKRLDAYHALLS